MEVTAFRKRFARQISFLHARLAPRSYLGLQLTAGASVLIGASWLFGGIAEDVVEGDALTVVDLQVAQWFHAHSAAHLTQAMLIFTHMHDPLPVTLYVVMLGVYLACKRSWYWVAALGLTVPLGMVLNVLMKFAFHRSRPSFDDPLLALTTYSFPSGHVAAATLLYAVMTAMVFAKTADWRWRLASVFITIIMVMLVALTRLYLGVHYLSDVMAAFAEGMAWLALSLTGLHTYWRHRFSSLRALRESAPPMHG